MSYIRDRIRVALLKGDLKSFCDTVRAARSKEWNRTGGARYARQRVREARGSWNRAWPSKPIPEGALNSPPPSSGVNRPTGTIVFVPSDWPRPTSLSAASAWPSAVSRELLADIEADNFLTSALGLRWTHELPPTAESKSGAFVSARGTRAEARLSRRLPRARTVLPRTRVMIMNDLSKGDRRNLRHAGAFVVQNQSVHLISGASRRNPPNAMSLEQPGNLWHLEAIGATDDRRLANAGHEALIGLIDTGVDPNHPEIAGKIAESIFFPPGLAAIRKVKARNIPMRDDDGHGTGVAALAVGSRVGIARGARLLVAATLTEKTTRGPSGTLEQIVSAVEWMIQIADDRPLVINFSGGVYGYNGFLKELTGYMSELGMGFVAAVGNAGPEVGVTASPANYGNVVAVGSINSLSQVAEHSSAGHLEGEGWSPNVCAPGEDVFSAAAGGGYRKFRGTSFAAPQVAAIVAILMTERPDLRTNAAGLRNELFTTCRAMNDNRAGRGLIRVPAEGADSKGGAGLDPRV